MKEDFNHRAWKLKQLQEEIRKEIETYIDGIYPLIKRIDFTYTDYGSYYKLLVFDENGDEVTKYREILTEQKIQINEEKVTKKVKNIDLIKEDIFKTIYNKIEIELYKIYNFKEIINK